MPYTTTHVLVAIVLIELFREYFFKNNNKFPRYYILIAAIAGILPDLEYVFQLPADLHRSFFHSLFFPLIFLVLGLIVLKLNFKDKWLRKRHMKLSFILFIFAGGSLLHILLDVILREGAMLFYPFLKIWIGLNLISYLPFSEELSLVIIDTILIFLWILWMEFKLKIDDYF